MSFEGLGLFMKSLKGYEMKLKRLIMVLMFLNLPQLQAQTWQSIGLSGLQVIHVYARGDTIWAGTIDSTYRREIYYSFNGGSQWAKVSDADTSFGGWIRLVYVDPRHILTIYAVDLRGRGLRSRDGGRTWEGIWTNVLPQPNFKRVKTILVSPHNENVVFCIVEQPAAGAGMLDDLYRSTDGGKTWTFVGGDFATSSHGVEIEVAFDPADSLRMYATGNTQFDIRFYVSSDGGVRWHSLSFCSAQRILPTRAGRIFLYPPIYWSDNGGVSWTTVDTARYPWEQWRPWHTILDPQSDSTLFGAGRYPSNAVRKSGDQGKSWGMISGSEALDFSYTTNYSLFDVELLSIDRVSKALYVGTYGRGVYRYNPLVSVQQERELPSAFHLYQNYPNPFNPSTNIKYRLPQRAIVRLSVYDVLGREVRTLVQQEQEAGVYSAEFRGDGLTSGVYYYRLTAGRYNEVRKMIMLK